QWYAGSAGSFGCAGRSFATPSRPPHVSVMRTTCTCSRRRSGNVVAGAPYVDASSNSPTSICRDAGSEPGETTATNAAQSASHTRSRRMRLTEKGIRASGLDRIGGGGVPSPAAQQSYVAPADVPAPSGRRTAFLPAALLALALLAGAAGAAVDAGPTLATAPTISGSATQGATLTATAGSWRGTGTLRYAYRWHRCDPLGARCLLLTGANAPRHKLTGADVGHTLAVDVRATDSSGATNGYSGLIGPIAGRKPQLVSVVQPGVTGTTTAVGGSVKVDNGKWTPAPKSFAYQWIRCNANGRACAPISGDITASHTIVPRDAKHALVAIVQAKSATASLGAPATPPPPPTTPPPAAGGPVATVSPTATGPAVQGKKLTGVAGTWTGSGKIKYAYQWYRCDAAGAHCKSIHGST